MTKIIDPQIVDVSILLSSLPLLFFSFAMICFLVRRIESGLQQAESIYQRVLDEYKAKKDMTNVEMLRVMHELGCVKNGLGKHKESRSLLTKCLQSRYTCYDT